MRFSTIVLKNAIRRPLRSILTALAIAVAVGTVVALVGISYGFERTFLDLYRGSGIGLIVVRAGSKQRMTSTLDERLADKIRALPGVRDVFGGLSTPSRSTSWVSMACWCKGGCRRPWPSTTCGSSPAARCVATMARP